MHKTLPKFYIFVEKYDSQIFKNNITNLGVIYRNYNAKNREIELTKIANKCKKKRWCLFISNDIKLTLKFKADGIYIPSFNKAKKFLNLENKKLKIIGSVHNQLEIHNKLMQKCKIIFLSPLYKTKKVKKILGIHKFNFLARSNKINFCALGGINNDNIKKLSLLFVSGMGGIKIFKKKPAYKRPVFQRINSLN